MILCSSIPSRLTKDTRSFEVGLFHILWGYIHISFGGCCFFLYCGMTSYGFGTTNTRSLLRLASLAAISTASKHLHNDLAKAIKALEQKKNHGGTFTDVTYQ